MKRRIVLIAGWGMPTGIVQPLADQFSDSYTVSVVALPGFQRDGLAVDAVSWEAMIDALSDVLAGENVFLVGWSMGGQLATLYAATHPCQVQGVLTMASNPCFVQRDDWAEAMPQDVFSDFLDGVSRSCSQTLKHFGMLCSQGGVQPRETVRFIRRVLADATPDSLQLTQLLALLGDTDTRARLTEISCPTIHHVAACDALVPLALNKSLSDRYPEHTIKSVEGGHTFWLDNPNAVVSEINQLVQEHA